MADEKIQSIRKQMAELQFLLASEELAEQERQRILEEEARHKPPRMRTAKGAVDALREEDPNTQVTVSMVRRLIRGGKVPCVPMGRKRLINVDTLIEYFRNAEALQV